jgi:hypothetical protein
MEDRPSRLSSTTLARVLSIAGHPFVLVPLTVAAATRNWIWTSVVAAGTILPLLVITLRNVRRGVWSDPDVSRREQRGGLYRAAFPLLALSCLMLWLLGAGPRMMRGFGGAAAMLALGLLGNRFLKISLHLMAAAYCSVTIAWLYPDTLYAILPFLAALAWSRHKLQRHTWAEIAVGLAIGTGSGMFAAMG